MNKSQGYLKYSPKTLGNRISENWYLVLHCDEDIGKYYRYLFYIANFKTIKLQRPAWKEHITVIRNEEPANEFKYLWEKYDSRTIEFEYEHNVKDNDHYYWFSAYSNDLLDIREELGLKREPEIPFHLSIGHK